MLQTIWYPIERIMAWRRARIVVPLVAGIVTCAALFALAGTRTVDTESVVVAAVTLGILETIIAWCAVWTWQRIWRDPTPAEGTWGQVVYRQGVKRLGGMMSLVMPPLNAFSTAWGDLGEGRGVATMSFLMVLWVGFFGWLAIGPWAGYWWGRFMARAAGIKKPGK